jgi:hypothetical protein
MQNGTQIFLVHLLCRHYLDGHYEYHEKVLGHLPLGTDKAGADKWLEENQDRLIEEFFSGERVLLGLDVDNRYDVHIHADIATAL